MELNIYDIIKGVITTSKSMLLQHKHGKVTLKVNKAANKNMVRDAVERIWNVKVRDIRIMNIKGKCKQVGRRTPFTLSDTKKAIVTLRPGYTIELPSQYERMGLPESEGGSKQGDN